ncbi:pilus assembly protein [Marinicella sediminis]|uniref:Pilus assembly protein n=1 Tax=Marinicella sediminis TaxID=1792834 RepID=A0ABV7J632_9GAMM|nr:PilC/PilY family type IV pilus protein [Marinicella sediminis]
MSINQLFKVSVMALTVSFAGMGGANASLLQLTHDPLFLNQTVPPAIAVTMDDSGSMAWSYMGSGSRGNEFADPLQNRIYFNPDITYTPPLRADGTRMPDSKPTAAWVDGYPNDMTDTVDLTQDYVPIREYVFSRTGNDVTIRFTYVNAVPNVNSTNIDDNRYTNYHPNFNTWGTRAFYLTRNNDGSYNINYINNAAQLQNFANWYSYYNSRMKLARAAISRAFANFGPSFKLGWQEINRDRTYTNLNKFELDHREDFYDWLFGVPTSGGTPLRSAFKRTTDLFKLNSSYYSEDFKTNLSCQQNFHIAISDGAWNGDSGYNDGTDGFLQDEQNFSLPGDTDNLYTGYNGGGEQVIYEASEDGSTLADIAFDAWARDLNPALDNNVKRFKKSYTDSTGTEIDFTNVDNEWDVPAFMWNPKNDPAYWQHVVTYNVGLGLEASRILEYQAGNFGNCPFITGLEPKEAVYRSLRNAATPNCDWPAANNDGRKVDDVWHASLNSRGGFFSANDPNQLIKALNEVVNNILERLSRGSTSTVSSGVITSNTEAYTPGFDSANWTGNLFARYVNSEGEFSDDILWDTSCILTDPTLRECPTAVVNESYQPFSDRNIFVYDKDAEATSNLNALSANLSEKLTKNAAEMLLRTGGTPQQLVNFIRGDQSTESFQNGPFRDRDSVLSDIVHSGPFLQRGPSANYLDDYWPEGSPESENNYLDFKIANQDRENILFIGSNSGMLHAIKIEDTGMGRSPGSEKWAFIPSKAFENAHRLADPDFKHWSYVDNTPRVTDAFINGSWSSVLVGGMRYGGQAFYAIDVTNPNASQPDVLWEFSDADDPDMGFSYGQATITRISSTGQWVALIPNGYNNSEKDYEDANDPRNIIGDGTAVLYVVSLSDGALLAKLDTNVGSQGTPNGMSTAVAVDSEYYSEGSSPPGTAENNNNIDIGADYAYAGDLYGNLWRFDFTNPDPSNWSSSIERVVRADNIKDRPITVKPLVVSIPNESQSKANDVVVVYGTGKYIEIPDRSTNLPAKQYFVGVYDGLTSGDSDLSITSGRFVDRVLKKKTANLRDILPLEPEDLPNFTADYGWKIELGREGEDGERLANPLTLIGGRIVLAATTVTAGIDPCQGGGVSWLTGFDPLYGGSPFVGPLFNGENEITGPDGDPITVLLAADSVKIDDLVIGRPPILENQGGGNINVVIEGAENTQVIALSQFTWRRRNWTNLLTE